VSQKVLSTYFSYPLQGFFPKMKHRLSVVYVIVILLAAPLAMASTTLAGSNGKLVDAGGGVGSLAGYGVGYQQPQYPQQPQYRQQQQRLQQPQYRQQPQYPQQPQYRQQQQRLQQPQYRQQPQYPQQPQYRQQQQ
jgi:hypothetical protein